MANWPFEWFFDGRYQYLDFGYGISTVDDDDSERKRVNWRNLRRCGWESCYLNAASGGDLPDTAGIYVLAHEREVPALYVGQAHNIEKRITGRDSRNGGKRDGRHKHHKVEAIVRLWESASMGWHDRGDARSELQVFWKRVDPPYDHYSADRHLLWCEAVAIGLLCPIMQGRADDMIARDWELGRGRLA
jgi:hypothetical protein